jgi:hypothetical protein
MFLDSKDESSDPLIGQSNDKLNQLSQFLEDQEALKEDLSVEEATAIVDKLNCEIEDEQAESSAIPKAAKSERVAIWTFLKRDPDGWAKFVGKEIGQTIEKDLFRDGM